jgi:hypothetical protein
VPGAATWFWHHLFVSVRAALVGLHSVAVFIAFGNATAFAQAATREDAERGRMSYDGSYVMVGPTLALVIDRSEGNGAALGGEASFVNVSDALWAGADVDAAHEFVAEETRLSIGRCSRSAW